MPDPRPPHLSDALSRFRAAADQAVDRGRRISGDAQAAGAAFQRDTEERVDRLRRGRPDRSDPNPTPADLRTEAAEYRIARGLPVPDLPDQDPYEQAPAPTPPVKPPPDDDDFSQFRVMHPV